MTDTPTFEWPEEMVEAVVRAIAVENECPQPAPCDGCRDEAHAALSAIAPQVGKLVEAAEVLVSVGDSPNGAIARLEEAATKAAEALEPWRRT